ncbi:hypothetical protein SORBI_3001G200400 [Sorghum bicolor]|uniref:Uncharacterized protein n=1 Tax=Sorghum bicolor TaxID=4558 RepID=A0A1Z5S6H3_SORBI|nr:hypothetical protein SORBI_3001G200400 [Sorghum bicolor]
MARKTTWLSQGRTGTHGEDDGAGRAGSGAQVWLVPMIACRGCGAHLFGVCDDDVTRGEAWESPRLWFARSRINEEREYKLKKSFLPWETRSMLATRPMETPKIPLGEIIGFYRH